jgi:hypothetical protein
MSLLKEEKIESAEGAVVGSVETGGADALVPSAETVITPVMANRAVVNFLDDMTYFLSELYIW